MPRTTVAEFGVDHVQVLDADGNLDEDLAPDLSEEELVAMYEAMKRSRRLDERAISLQRRGELGTYPPAIGQEAAEVGAAWALRETDWFVPSFRESAAFLVRGAPLSALLVYAAGMEEGSEVPPERRDLPPAIPTGSQTLHATGLGWAQAIRGDDAATLVFFGDGSSSEGDVYEAVNVAGVFDAHAVFLCNNNQYAISVPRWKQSRAETLAQKGLAGGVPGVQVDGNDLLGVYVVVRDALEMARDGQPVFVEALTYRRSMHTTSDDPTVYRSREEEAEWAARDPIERVEALLRERGLLDDERVEDVEATVERELDEAVAAMERARRDLDPEDMFTYAFAELPPLVRDQLEAFRRRHGE